MTKVLSAAGSGTASVRSSVISNQSKGTSNQKKSTPSVRGSLKVTPGKFTRRETLRVGAANRAKVSLSQAVSPLSSLRTKTIAEDQVIHEAGLDLNKKTVSEDSFDESIDS